MSQEVLERNSQNIFEAIEDDEPQRALVLINRGDFDTEYRKGSGNTALITATKRGQKDVVIALIDAGADLNAQNIFEMSALMRAAEFGWNKIVEVLIEARAQVDLRDKKGNSALIIAAEVGEKDTVKRLVEAHAYLDAKNDKD